MKMILDMNALLGRWPFAPLKYDNVDGILTLMDRAGIDKAVVTSLNSVFYYDCEIGNREVGEACKQYPDRFIPLAVINPNLLLWRDHLKECIEEYGIKGLKLHPDYHKFSLLERKTAEVMHEARRLELPVYIQTSLLDMRHHPGYCLVSEVPISEVAQAVDRYSENTFIVGGGQWFMQKAVQLVNSVRKNKSLYIVTDGCGGPFDGLGTLVEQIGSSRLLFGTRIPILYAEASKLVIEQSEISAEDREKILGGNAAKLLSLTR
jgi:predicted TIM-barrel fold metal-dependent hydrolase